MPLLLRINICQTIWKATRQLNQLGNIKHELGQIFREAEIFLESTSNSQKFKALQSEAEKADELRIELQTEVEGSVWNLRAGPEEFSARENFELKSARLEQILPKSPIMVSSNQCEGGITILWGISLTS